MYKILTKPTVDHAVLVQLELAGQVILQLLV